MELAPFLHSPKTEFRSSFLIILLSLTTTNVRKVRTVKPKAFGGAGVEEECDKKKNAGKICG